jgi:hypothetical protein
MSPRYCLAELELSESGVGYLGESPAEASQGDLDHPTAGIPDHPDLKSQSSQYAHIRGFIRTNWYSSRSSSAGLRSSRMRASSTTDRRCSNSSLESWPFANARCRGPAASSLPRSPTRRRPVTDNGLPGGGSTSSTASEHRPRDDLRESDLGRLFALESRMHHHIPIFDS